MVGKYDNRENPTGHGPGGGSGHRLDVGILVGNCRNDIAGDDTIFVLVRNRDMVGEIVGKFKKLMK